jgi:predicted GIY-YIG superfamily endonuclease
MIYIVELSRPIGNPKSKHGTALYYLGYCDDDRLFERLNEHQAGRGAAMLRAAKKQGITFGVVMTIPGATREDERRLKRQKNTPRIVARYRYQQLGIPF